MKKLLTLFILLFGLNAIAQKLTCADFKNGEFLIPGDSLNQETYKVTRSNGKQIEVDKSGDKILADIVYINDCRYILTYDSNSSGYDEISQYINDSGGLRIEVLEIKGDTLFYNGVIKNDSIRYEMPGKIIKLN